MRRTQGEVKVAGSIAYAPQTPWYVLFAMLLEGLLMTVIKDHERLDQRQYRRLYLLVDVPEFSEKFDDFGQVSADVLLNDVDKNCQLVKILVKSARM